MYSPPKIVYTRTCPFCFRLIQYFTLMFVKLSIVTLIICQVFIGRKHSVRKLRDFGNEQPADELACQKSDDGWLHDPDAFLIADYT